MAKKHILIVPGDGIGQEVSNRHLLGYHETN